MARNSKIVSLSLPPEVLGEIETLAKQTQGSRSEVVRRLLQAYKGSGAGTPESSDLASVLRAYWDMKAGQKLEVMVVGLAIVHDDEGRVLIGRRGKDPIVQNLSWAFPGGKLESLDFANEVKKRITERTSLGVDVRNLVTARIIPDAALGGAQVVAMYFDCVPEGGELRDGGEEYSEFKWVRPMEVFQHFTSSTSDEVTRFLASLPQ
jgi:ADP-ribose pyrophosphatase YjhB (NUDIX family)